VDDIRKDYQLALEYANIFNDKPQSLAMGRKLQNGWICWAGASPAHPGQPKRSPYNPR
jgi:hypothetical protein